MFSINLIDKTDNVIISNKSRKTYVKSRQITTFITYLIFNKSVDSKRHFYFIFCKKYLPYMIILNLYDNKFLSLTRKH
jgi:hypothetical protein